jgi:general secretion pathway protein G
MRAKMSQKLSSRSGFSLVELVIVIVIIGIIAAIAVPRISRGAAGAGASGLRGDLYVLRNAIDLYAAEHNGTYPLATTFEDQLTKYTDIDGATSDTKGDPYFYGPYLVSVPALKVGSGTDNGKGANGVAAAAAGTVGWIYDQVNGIIKANSVDAEDESGDKFDTY